MNTINGNFIEPSIPNNNATVTLNIAGNESTMKFTDFVNAIQSLLSTPTLQQVTESGDITTKTITVEGISSNGGYILPSSVFTDIVVKPDAAITVDTNLELVLEGATYILKAQLKP